MILPRGLLILANPPASSHLGKADGTTPSRKRVRAFAFSLVSTVIILIWLQSSVNGV